MSGELTPTSDPVLLAAADELSTAEQHYVGAARAANTLRGYRSDWREFTSWCATQKRQPLPAAPGTVSAYLTMLAAAGAKVGTMSRRLSAIRFAHRLQNLTDPCENARVVTVWEGIRREHTQRPDQARPLMPPDLWHVLDACPQTRKWKTKGRAEEPDLTGARDRALLLVGFVGALRRSEISALDVEHIREHANGLVLDLPRSKTNQRGDVDELVALPRSRVPTRCPVTALTEWMTLAGISSGPVFRPVSKGNRATARRLTAGAVNDLVQTAVLRAGLVAPASNPTGTAEISTDKFGGYSAHSLRAGFVTYAHSCGASDRAVARQTRHRSLASVGTYIRLDTVWDDNAATKLNL